MTLASIAASVAKRAPRYGYHRSSVGTKKKLLNGAHYNPKMNGERTHIGPRGVPPISICVKDMDDNTLLTFGALNDHSAREEILKRHIMDTDDCSYETACDMFNKIADRNMKGYYMVTLPYKIGISSAIFAGVVAFPLVFHLPTIEWFNEWAVTCDIPEARELETPLEVSIWAWNWMEPPLGTISFALLCSQYARSQMNNLGVRPYTRWIKSRRGHALAEAFPMYDEKILAAYSETADLQDWQIKWLEKRRNRK
mmetsp:Transcript_24309/g.37152  ORF Transcript_24309/g.37152 Transcript_24309/m.37152 type:complete len:254 (+) Transcript_24309:86-847(+)